MVPEISVIIPVYNAEPFLPGCIGSVLAQTFTGFEVILVDDGSTDGSGAVCDRYAAEHGNVKALHVPNGGAALARKLGVQEAAGGLVTLLFTRDFLSLLFIILRGASNRAEIPLAKCIYAEDTSLHNIPPDSSWRSSCFSF